MTTSAPNDLADHVIATLRAHAADVRQAGIRHVSLFGSVARGDAAAHSDIDLAAELMPEQPWADIRGMGNRLRHAYDRLSLDVLWNAVRHDVPGLADDARRTTARLATDGQPRV